MIDMESDQILRGPGGADFEILENRQPTDELSWLCQLQSRVYQRIHRQVISNATNPAE